MPIAQNDSFTVTEDDGPAILGSVFSDNGNGIDTDPQADDFLVSLVDGSAGGVGQPVTGSQGGIFTISNDGEISFDPNGDFDYLFVGETVTTTITYTIDDFLDDGDPPTTATVSVTVTGENDAPMLVGPLTLDVNLGDGLNSVFILDNAFDPDDSDFLDFDNFMLVSGDDSGVGSGSVNEITIDPSFYTTLAPGATETIIYSYDVFDTFDVTVAQTLVITVTNPASANSDPIAQDDNVSTDNDMVVTGNVFANNGNGPDTDPDGDPIVVTNVQNGNGSSVGAGTQIGGSDGGVFTINFDGTFTFDPGPDFLSLGPGDSTTTDVLYTIADDDGATSEAILTVTVFGPNNIGPQAQNDELATDTDTGIMGSVFADNGNGPDTDPDGDPLTVSNVNNSISDVGFPVAGSAGGLFTIFPDGSYTFDPNGEFTNVAPGQPIDTSVTYTANDGALDSNTATVTVTVSAPANTPPEAQNDSVSTEQSQIFVGNVFDDNGSGPDSDPDGDNITVTGVEVSGQNVGSAVAGSNGGMFTINSDGTFSFDPSGDFSLPSGGATTTSVIYDIADGNGGNDFATVTVTVTGPTGNTPPVARFDGFNSNEDIGFNGNVFADNGSGTDFDPDGDPITVVAVNGSTANVGVFTAGNAGGLFSIDAMGNISFNPNGEYEGLSPGESAETEITYTISDGFGAISTATVAVDVFGVNDDPVVAAPLAITLNENDSVAILDLVEGYSDVDDLDFSTIDVLVLTGGNPAGVTEDLAFEEISIDPSAYSSLNAGESEVITYTFTIRDDFGGSVDQTITITINGLGTGAPVPQDDVVVGDETSVLSGNVFADNGMGPDTDPNGDTFTVTAVENTAGNVSNTTVGTDGGLFTINPDGTFTFDPNGDFNDLEDNDVEPTSVDYTVTDTDGNSETATLTVNVQGSSNTSPIAENDMIVGDPANNSFDLFADNGAGLDRDPDGDDIVITTIDGVGVVQGDSVTLSSGLVVTYNGDGNVSLSATRPGLYTEMFDYTISDGNGGVDDALVSPVFSINTLDISDINGQLGFTLTGIDAGDSSGRAVASAGDFNHDGFDDFIIGARFADANGNVDAGESYLIFGTDAGFPDVIDLGALDGSNGFVINGASALEQSGRSVAGLGDINGDGFDDVAIGAIGTDANGNFASGATYVVFGSDGSPGASLDLGSLNGSNGFVINGVDAGDQAGTSVSSAGDVNGDGIADILVGAILADPSGVTGAGEAYVVFGQQGGFSSSFDLSSLNGSNGFAINGLGAFDYAGVSVSGGGDINGDGIDDILIGANEADPGGLENAGQTYVVFGQQGGFSSSLDVSALNGSNGFVINGEGAGDRAGESVAHLGDINGDGLDDILIGAIGVDPSGSSFAGESYVVFGNAAGFGGSIELSNLNGNNGFSLVGVDDTDLSGFSVSSAGDFNGDGLNDLLIGALFADPNGGADTGEAYIVFGRSTGFSSSIDLSSLNGGEGFRLTGIDAGDNFGSAVSGAGDVNGDGFDDILIGARGADVSGNNDAGESYVVFGYDVPSAGVTSPVNPQEYEGKRVVSDVLDTSVIAESFEAGKTAPSIVQDGIALFLSELSNSSVELSGGTSRWVDGFKFADDGDSAPSVFDDFM